MPHEGRRLRGAPGSPGTYTGPVRVVRAFGEFDRVKPGDVLVCPATDPSWSVLFSTIGAVVTDAGGALSHSAIVAREHGIPAVLSVTGATRALRDGQIVTVDGTAGSVTIADSIAAVIGLVVMGTLAVPLLSLRLGEPRSTTLAKDGPVRTALDTLTDGGVPSGVLTPIEVLVKGDPTAVTAKLAALPGIDTVVAPDDSAYRQSGTALVDVLPVNEAGQGAGRVTVRQVRDAVADDAAVLGVGGSGAQSIDAVHAVYGSFPLMLVLVSIVTFLLLARALRSVLLAAKAVFVNLLSVAAAYGVLVLVWQYGHGSNAIWGIASTGTITFWVPVFVFAFLFGLSMDYEVFILTRVREAYDRTGSTAAAAVEGLARTGRLVTSAALILAFAFLAMSTGPQTDLKIMATGLGAGILLDAFVVRTLLVPALVALFGRWNWWLPTWLARVLRVQPSSAARESPYAGERAIPAQPAGRSRV